jgi:hypothetical protein
MQPSDSAEPPGSDAPAVLTRLPPPAAGSPGGGAPLVDASGVPAVVEDALADAAHGDAPDAAGGASGAPPAAVLIQRPPPARPRELLAMAAIVVLADLALSGGAGGAGLALLFTGVPAVLFAAIRTPGPSPRRLALAALLGLVAARCVWQSSGWTLALGLALLPPFAVALRTTRSFVPELAASAVASVWGAARQLGRFAAGAARLAPPVRRTRAASAAVYVPALLVVVFAAIFAAANPVIQGWLSAAAGAIGGKVWLPTPARIALWLASALSAAALLRPAVRAIAGLDARLGTAEASEPTGEPPAPLGIALARNGMIALNLLFLGYNALDAVYLWAGRPASGVSFTEYAHAGTAWLTIAFVLSTIVIGAMFRGPIEHDPRGRLARGLAYVWAAQNFLLAAGTFRRIAMYISYSGLTELRIVGILGTALATLGLAIIVVKLARHRTMLWVMRRQLDALAIAVVLYLVAPTGALAMRYNVARIELDHYRPLLHLFEQPIRDEALPALARLLDHPDPVVRGGVAVIAARHRQRLVAAEGAPWHDFEFARRRALAALDPLAARLDAALAAEPENTLARLRGVACGVNDEVERAGDEAPFDWRTRSYPPRDEIRVDF